MTKRREQTIRELIKLRDQLQARIVAVNAQIAETKRQCEEIRFELEGLKWEDAVKEHPSITFSQYCYIRGYPD